MTAMSVWSCLPFSPPVRGKSRSAPLCFPEIGDPRTIAFEITIGEFCGLADADPRSALDGDSFWKASRRVKREFTAEQAQAVIRKSETKGLCESARSSCDLTGRGVRIEASELAHLIESLDGFRRPQEDGRGVSCFGANDVYARMNPITPVRVEPSSGSEHRFVALRGAAMCVGCGVAAVAKIGLDFDDSGHEPPATTHAPNEATADQPTSYDTAIERVERLAKRRAERHFISIGEIMARAPGLTAYFVAGKSFEIWRDFPLDSIRSQV